MSKLLAGKVAVVSGAGRGQGQSHAARLAEEGADVILLDRCAPVDTMPYQMASEADLQHTVKLVENFDRRAVVHKVDVRDSSAVADAVADGIAELGRLDIVVANAGIMGAVAADKLTDEQWRETIDVNLTGVWNVCRAAIPHLIEAGNGGAIVMTGSAAVENGVPHLAHYSASKGGVTSLMRSLAVELAPHMIRVNVVHPTTVNTGMVQNDAAYELFLPHLLGSPEKARSISREEKAEAFKKALKVLNAMPIPWVEPIDVSNAIVFLVSDQARYITGTELRVDGGSVVK